MAKTKTYSKTHSSAKAARSHAAKIRKRGGKVTTEKKGNKIVLHYYF